MWFLLVDRILEFRKGESLIALKNVSPSEGFLVNHFYHGIIMPYTFIIEAVAQAAGWLISVSSDFKKAAILVALGTVEFNGVVRPGDQLILEVEIESLQEEAVVITGRAKEEGEVVGEMDRILFVLIDTNQLAEPEKTKLLFSLLKKKEHFYE
jgi:3-hydroxyacyl-[acyl-carrier-protein] dehydratase